MKKCVLTSLTVVNAIIQLNNFGLYRCDITHFKDLPHSIANWKWVFIGGIINFVVLMLVVWSSFPLILFANNPLDLVLNVAALFFLTEIDDFIC